MTVSVGFLSYGVAAVGFLILTLLLAISWEGRAQGVRLVVACAVTTLWAAVLAWAYLSGGIAVPVLVALEALRYAAWIVVLAGIAAAMGMPARALRTAEVVAVAGVFGAGALTVVVPPSGETRLLAVVGIAYSLAGIVLLEQVYRNARQELRYTLRYLVIALGLLFAYDLFVSAQTELFSAVESSSWQARGFLAVLTIPMIAIAARRNPGWSLNIFVSRQVVFYTATFFAVGAYLFAMAVGSYLIVRLSGEWGRVAQLVFIAGAAVALLGLLASADLRRRAQVFISKHFYRNKYDYRVEWLRFIQTLSESDEVSEGAARGDGAPVSEAGSPYRRAIRAIAQIISSPGGAVFVRSDDAREFVVAGEWPGRHRSARLAPVPVEHEMMGFLERRQWIIDLHEYVRRPDSYDNLALPASLQQGSRSRLVVPLMEGSELFGFMLLDEPPSGFKPNYEDRDLLKTVGRHVATYLAQHEADRRLADGRQFEAYHRLTAFVMHDLKNLAAQLALIVDNAARHRRNPEFIDDAISTVANSTERMQRLIQQLQSREVAAATRTVSLTQSLQRAVERCDLREPRPRLTAPGAVYVRADADRLVSTLEHLIRNAQDATPPDGRVDIECQADAGLVRVLISDTGAGMSQEFVNTRLFRPFDSTKGSKGMGIGAYQAREYVATLGGTMTVRSVEGQGTTFEITLPEAKADEPSSAAGATRDEVTFSGIQP